MTDDIPDFWASRVGELEQRIAMLETLVGPSLIGRRVRVRREGAGKVVGAEGNWLTVLFDGGGQQSCPLERVWEVDP